MMAEGRPSRSVQLVYRYCVSALCRSRACAEGASTRKAKMRHGLAIESRKIIPARVTALSIAPRQDAKSVKLRPKHLVPDKHPVIFLLDGNTRGTTAGSSKKASLRHMTMAPSG